MATLGTQGKIKSVGSVALAAKDALGFGLDMGYSIQKKGRFQLNHPVDIGSKDLNTEAKQGTGEISGSLGLRIELDAISADGYLGIVMSWIGISVADIGIKSDIVIKPVLALNMKNAAEVEKTGSSDLALEFKIACNISPTLPMTKLIHYLVSANLELSLERTLFGPYKSPLEFTAASVTDDGQGHASLSYLSPTSTLLGTLFPSVNSSSYKGVLSLKGSSVYNDSLKDISYDLSECEASSDYKIVSPAIGCTGLMCGVVKNNIELCKGRLSISSVIGSAKVKKTASGVGTVVNNIGDVTVSVSGSPLSPNSTSLQMANNTAKSIRFSARCPAAPGVYRGSSTVSAGAVQAQASNIMVCHKDENRGDPHIVTGDGLGYDYFASGDYILSRIPGVSGYEIQGRFLPGFKTSWPQAVALNVGSDKVEIQGRLFDKILRTYPFNAFAVWINGKAHRSNNPVVKLPSGGLLAISETKVDIQGRAYPTAITVIWPEKSQAKNYGVVLNVADSGSPFVEMLIARPADFAGQERGLLGNNDGNPNNDFIRRNGEVLGVDHNISFTELYALFGTDWLARPYESLFRNSEAIKPQFPTDVVTLTPEQRALGEQACAGLTGFYREACIIDVGLTGSAELVKEYYANTDDLNTLSSAIVTPSVDQARYSMQVADKAYEADSSYYLHYKQNISIAHEAGKGKFILLVRPPRGASTLLSTGEMSHTAEGNYTTHIEVDCIELNAETNSAFLHSTGAVQLWLQDPLSGTASKMLSEVALPCTDASKRAGYSLKRGSQEEQADSNDTHLHYTQPLGIVHTNSYSGEYILEITAPVGAMVKLNGSTTELNITGSAERNDTLELDCSMAESNATNGSIRLWEKDKLSGTKAYNYANYSLSCHKSKVLKTGQTTSYVDYDDGHYQTGETRSYTRDDAKEVVTDNVTGLMWQDNSEAKTVTKDWSGAIAHCEALSLGGYEDWRLPTRKELGSIVDFGRTNPSLDPEFLNFASSHYWSSTTSAFTSSYAWFVYFNDGYHYYYDKHDNRYVRCVRAGQ